MNDAIRRIIDRHYMGNTRDPRAQKFLARMMKEPEAQKPFTQRLLSMLALK